VVCIRINVIAISCRSRSIGPRTPGSGNRKAGLLWEKEIQRALGLTINLIEV
jgi:hypothetical protein